MTEIVYGIGGFPVLKSEPLPDWAIAAFGALELVQSSPEKSTMRDLFDDLVPVRVSGCFPPSAISELFELDNVLFKSARMGIFLSAETCQVRAPLKPASTFKQLLNNFKDESISFDTFCQAKSVRRRVTVSEEADCITASLPFDFISLLPKSTSLKDVYAKLRQDLHKQLAYIIKCAALIGLKNGDSINLQYYYHPDSLLPVRLPLVGRETPDFVQQIRKILRLPPTMSLAKRNHCGFGVEPEVHGELNVLTNVHDLVKSPALPIISLVKGRYGYYHYGQQGKNDSGWGCAYRSLQTCHSWFYLQGHTDKMPPTHAEIQKTLVKMGDKPAKFMGSKEWIGSFEVQMLLNELIGVENRMMNVQSGGDLVDKVEELVEHFERVGTPVMIGGNNLAHTILGVAFDDATREAAFLILDPHYVGVHVAQSIKDKGVYWKSADFWNSKTYYNLCLPQTTQCAINVE